MTPRRTWARGLPLLLMVGFVSWLLSRVNWPATELYLGRIGARAPLMLLPYLFVVMFDTLGWHASFESSVQLSWRKLWCIRVSTDALANSLPAGMVVGEAMKALLLRRLFGLGISEATANIIISKFALGTAQAIFLLLGLSLCSRELARASDVLIGRRGLEWLGVTVALLFLASLVGAATLAQRAILSSTLARVRRIGRGAWHGRLAGWEASAASIDHGLAVIARVPARQALRSVSCFLLGWLCLGIENWVILWLLRANISLANALSMESVVSIVRILFFFVPSAFGAQEMTYYALLKLFDVPAAENVAAAFMLTKRAKEAIWIALGYLLLTLLPAKVAEARATTRA
jgi:glycosyltransferase 2 family protein